VPRTALAQAASPQPSSEGAADVPEPAPAPAQIVRPVALDASVDYPPEAEGDAVVVLRFLVTEAGAVREVEVLSGDEPFASRAVMATQHWSFSAARRGERPVAARIEFEVRFEQQKVLQTTPTPPPTSASEAPPPPEPLAKARGSAQANIQEAVEVSVQGERPAGAITLSRAEGRQIPGALGDPLRAVDMMPGVTPTVSGLPLYYVRGSPPGNIGYFIDEVRIPVLYHAFLGPSVVHPELLQQVTLYPGPYPVSFGRYAGAIVSADLRVPRHEFGYRAEIGIFDSGGYVETPFADNRGSFFFGGRYSYLGALVSAFTPKTLEFWNYQSLIEYDITPRDKVSALVLGALDYLENDPAPTSTSPAGEFWGTEFHRVDLRYDRSFSADTSARLAFTIGVDRTRWSEGKLLDKILAGRMRFAHRFSEQLNWTWGLAGNQDEFDLELDDRSQNFLDLRDLLRSRGDSAYGGYTELVWHPTRAVTVPPGVRVDLFSSGDDSEVGVDPRLTARLRLTDRVEAVHGVGVSHQAPNYIPNVPGARVAGLDGGLQQAIHTSSGVEVQLPDDWFGVASAFQNVILDVTDPYSSTQDFAINAIEARKRPRARAFGLELSLRRSLTRRFGAFASYTLSRTTRSFPDAPNYAAYETLAGSDHTHVLNLAGLYTLGPNWRFGLRSVFYSGVPGRKRGTQPVFDQPRAIPFFRLDGRVERRFRWGEHGYVSVVGELLNATMSSEVIRRECDDGQACQDTAPGAVFLPNFKVEASY
jgi:TonB family protein